VSQWKVYAYDNCDTCRRALRLLEARRIAYQKIDVTVQPPSIAELRRALSAVGDIRRLFNRSGQAYREGKLSERLPGLSPDQALDLLVANGRLIKRPLAFHPKGALVGFDAAEWEKVIAG
jgi:Spx/MgsR family transcriptional regulator